MAHRRELTQEQIKLVLGSHESLSDTLVLSVCGLIAHKTYIDRSLVTTFVLDEMKKGSH